MQGINRNFALALLVVTPCLLALPARSQVNQQPAQHPAETPQKRPKPTNADEFPPDPLEIKEPDPLLPSNAVNQPLTPAEQKQLAIALDGLNQQAAAQFKQGDREGAFVIWYRELRLRRLLGSIQEVTALGRVGDIAWKENRTPDVRIITKRLDEILASYQPPKPGAPTTGTPAALSQSDFANRVAVLDALGLAYQQVRLPQTAVSIYQQVLAEARDRRDTQKIDATLNTLGQLHLSWFDYTSAAATYRELLQRSQASGDRLSQLNDLTQLAYIHEQAKQPDQAIPYLQQLIALYQTLANPKPIPALKIRLGDDYQATSQLAQAEQSYRDAYQLAEPSFQFAYASEALQRLGALYRTNDRLDAALQVYDYLVSVEQQSYNLYGMMNAYDQIGQIHLLRKQYPQAIGAFQQGLTLARQLKYREDYFTAQIQQVSQLSRQSLR